MGSQHHPYNRVERRKTPRTSELVKYSGVVLRKSEKAILFRIVPNPAEYTQGDTKGYDEVWFPRTQINKLEETRSVLANKLDTIIVTAWIAKEKGLIEHD